MTRDAIAAVLKKYLSRKAIYPQMVDDTFAAEQVCEAEARG